MIGNDFLSSLFPQFKISHQKHDFEFSAESHHFLRTWVHLTFFVVPRFSEEIWFGVPFLPLLPLLFFFFFFY